MNFDILNQYVEKGLLKRQVSPCGFLVLYDYTEQCQFDRAWDEVTLNHRGTVYETSTGNIVARSFPKFFNFSELSPEVQKEKLKSTQFSTYEKMDGSLGIIYFYNGEWRVNTRGSFTSDQAIKGRELLYRLETHRLNKEYTYLAEIIYPENRIVVDYGKEEFLCLIGIISTEHGHEFFIREDDVFEYSANIYYFKSISGVLDKLKTLPYNEEGYVVQFEDGSRAKFKGDEYIAMHKIVTGISPLTIWEKMEGGKVPVEFMMAIPEEFRPQYEEIAQCLESLHLEVKGKIAERFQEVIRTLNLLEVPAESRKKTLGLYLKNNPHDLDDYIFPVYLAKYDVVDNMIKKAIRPKGNVL